MQRIGVALTDSERAALWKLGRRERRDPRDQAAILIRKGLEHEGLIADELAPVAGPQVTLEADGEEAV
jgi:hypothetical protein